MVHSLSILTASFVVHQLRLVKRERGHGNLKFTKFRTIDIKETLLGTCEERGDEWSEAVKARILHAHDLHAADAVYHQTCSVNFRTKNDDEQITIKDLIDLMQQKLAQSESETYTYMKKRLEDHFGEKIIYTLMDGKPVVVTMKTTAKAMLQDYYDTQKKETNTNEEKIRLVKAAAKLIKQDIKDIELSNESYPNVDDIESPEAAIRILPDTLRFLLEELFVGTKTQAKVAAIGQALMQATRPRLGVQLYHHFASQFLIDTLHHLGFCCSYEEVHRFERNAAKFYGANIPDLSTQFVQYAADNVDHNIRTLDGLGTFHGMGMIATITPGITSRKTIPRLKATSLDVAAVGRVDVRYSREERHNFTAITYQKLQSLQVQNSCENLDVLWKSFILFGSPRPAWSGMMQFVHKGDHPGKSSVMFLPMIDLNPSDSTCIFSTLKYVSQHAQRHNVTPVITFDQPLWWKALMIVNSQLMESDLRQIVLRLGGLNAEMSFLGCFGHLMASSGLQEVLELIYAPNTVIHMMSGKAQLSMRPSMH